MGRLRRTKLTVNQTARQNAISQSVNNTLDCFQTFHGSSLQMEFLLKCFSELTLAAVLLASQTVF